MKKTILGVSALVAASVLPVANVFAIDPLDYAKSIGSIDGADTINWVVEATSDGGYVVGGQTLACYKGKFAELDLMSAAKVVDSDRELVEISECLEHADDVSIDYGGGFRVGSLSESTKPVFSIVDICRVNDGNVLAEAEMKAKSESDEDDEYYYTISCIDYIAKFQKDGVKQWLTLINDGDRPVSVRETSSDYRLLTNGSKLYTFSKTGEEGLSTWLNGDNWFETAVINSDGSITTVYDNTYRYYDKNANLKRTLSRDSDTYYYNPNVLEDEMSLFRFDGGYLTFRIEFENSEPKSAQLVKISNDLSTVEPVKDIDMSSESAIMGILFTNNDSDFATVSCEYEMEPQSVDGLSGQAMTNCKVTAYDKNGEQIAEKNMDEIVPNTKGAKPFDKDFVIINEDTGVVTRFDRNLNKTFDYTLDENEVLKDVTPLNDDSIVGVGFSTGTTDHYEVDTSTNGVYLRLDADSSNQGAPNNGGTNVKNPGTLDNIEIIAGVGGVILLLGLIAGRKIMARR